MGDSSESSMETDVSSTTGDAPDSQEVAGSQSNMETIIVVVEQVKDEEPASSHTKATLETTAEHTNEPDKSEETPPQENAVQKESIAQNDTVSCNQETQKPITPKKVDASQVTPVQPDTQTVISTEPQSETVDSSSNVEAQESIENSKIEIPTLDTQPVESLNKEPEQKPMSPIKEVQPQGSVVDSKQVNLSTEKLAVIDNVDSTDSNKKGEDATRNKTPMDVCIAIEASNDTQIDANSDMTEKEHNKSISRELKSLIKSAKESKIINECTQVTSKMRKSRTPLDTSGTNLNISVETEKIQGQRRNSSNSQQSNSSEKSEKVLKRSMRSQNPEFVIKVKQFLNSVTGKVQKETEAGTQSDEESPPRNAEPQNEVAIISSKKKKMTEELETKDGKLRCDPFCWRCHWGVEQETNEKGHSPMSCTICPRSFHYKCLSLAERNKISEEANWACPECRLIMQAESSESRSPAMKKLSLGMLCELLTYALDRMKYINGVEPFTQPVNRVVFPDYDKYVVHPMDLSLMREHIKEGHYGSTEAFYADAQWILHNSVIFNTLQSKLSSAARALLRSFKTEMGEIEACPECYRAAHSRRQTWFIDVCSTPHILLWAKLKGFPYWPAKGMSVNSSGLVDVRFFGAHDRAWVPSRDCFLFSEKDPNNFRAKRQDIIDSMQEAEQHIRNISRKYGKFVYPPFRTQFEPSKLAEQLKLMIPNYEPEATTPNVNTLASSPAVKRFRLSSKGSKSSASDRDSSVKEDNANTSKETSDNENEEKKETKNDKEKPAEVEAETTPSKKRRKSAPQEPVTAEKEIEKSRKRRRSQLEEAIITIIPTPEEKRRKLEEKTDDKKKTDTPETKKKDNNEKQQKSSENGATTPKTKTHKEYPSGKKTTVTYVSRTPKINPLKIVISKRTSRASTPKSTPEKSLLKEKTKQNETDKEKPDTPKTKQKKRKSTDDSAKTPDQKSNAARHSGKGICVPVRIVSKPSVHVENKDAQKPKEKTDDNTTLAELARESAKKTTGLPTITNVRSLSETVDNSPKLNKNAKIVVEVPANSSVFAPTSTDSVTTSKEAANKLQRLRQKDPEPSSLIGKVGVRAFARMTSPPRPAGDVQVEIKSEPIDVDLDAERQTEKLDLMTAFRLRPVNPAPVSSLRDVRITKVTSTSTTPVVAKAKTPELRPRAKKSFPQPRKPDDGRSELNCKNSMVYIPIQPPMSQAPVRPPRPPPAARTMASNTAVSCVNSLVNTVTTPLVPSSLSLPVCSSPMVPSGPSLVSSGPSLVSSGPSLVQTVPSLVQSGPSLVPGGPSMVPGGASLVPGGPSLVPGGPSLVPPQNIGQVPTNVHTVPLLTTMNGQWTISLQPIMSVGGVDSTSSPPLVNGVPDRSGPTQSIVPLPPALISNNSNNGGNSNVTGTQVMQNNLVMTNTVLRQDTNTGELPRMQRPIIINPQEVPPPPSAGPITARITSNATKLADLFRSLLEESIDKVDDPTATVTALKLQLEHATWKHKQEVDELIHTHDLQLAEIRLTMEKEKLRAVAEAKKNTMNEIDSIKLKQWCAWCKKEAHFYCCWWASYCEAGCQRAHWTAHRHACEQQAHKSSTELGTEPESRLHPKPITTKTSQGPMLTVGGKVVNQDKTSPQKSAIIMSMVEDPNGNQTMKCVGFQHLKQPPVIINKQIMANDEKSKKVVTSSGGYLIVGTGAPNAPLVTQTLRPFFST